MTAVPAPLDAPRAPEGQVLRAAVASTLGTAIEWYDFILYGIAAALVFPKLFFPHADAFTRELLAFSTFFVGFAARPVGAAIFGHFGDRLGRKATLVSTLMLMGLATFAVGLVPDASRIGVWGAVLLTLLRLLQGIGVGGEWGGSVLLAMEWGPGHRRGFVASWPQFGAPLGLLLANGAVALASAWSGPAFPTWGWRLPFLASAALFGVGMFIRLGIGETPVFRELVACDRIARQPVLEVLRHHGREVLLTSLLRGSQMSCFYLFTTFVLTYGTRTLGLPKGRLLGAIELSAAISLFTVPLFGFLSDRFGRRRTYLVGAIAMAVLIFPYFQLLDTRQGVLVTLAIALALPLHDVQYGPQSAFIAEAFPGRLRCSGASLGYQLSALTAGGPTPLIALALLQRFHTSAAVAAYISVVSVVSAACAVLLPERATAELA